MQRAQNLAVRALRVAALGAILGVSLGVGPLEKHRSTSYQIESDLDRQTVREIGRHMDLVSREYTRRFSQFPVRNATAMTLWVFEKQEDYVEFLDGKGVNGTGTGGMFFVGPEGAGLASYLGGRPLELMFETLRHEGLHQFAFLRIHESLPQWVNEGLAEYFGYSIVTRRGGGLEPGVVDEGAIKRVREALAAGDVFPLEELLFMSNATWNSRVNSKDKRASVMYDQSWSVVHFLIHAEGGRFEPLMMDFLRAVWQGLSVEQASERVFTRDLEPMQEAWETYILELEPDPLLLAQSRLRVYAMALARLHEAGINPANVEEMTEALMEHQFEGNLVRGDEKTSITGDPASEGGWWIEMPESRKGRAATLKLIPDRRGAKPPAVEVRGLRQKLRLQWTVPRGGEPEHAIVVG